MHNPKGAWRMCAAATLMLFCILGLAANSFSVLMPYLMQQCGLSDSQNSSLVLVRSLFSFGSLFLAGKYYKLLDIRLGGAIAALLGSCGMVVYGFASQTIHLYIAAAVSGLSFALGGMYMASILLHRWFRVHGSVAMGICAASSGAGTIVGAPVLTALVENVSLSAALFALAGAIAACALLFFAVIRNNPPDWQPVPQKPAEKRVRGSFRFQWMYVAVILIAVPASTVFGYLSVHFKSLGLSAYEVSMLISVVGTALMAGKFIFGESVDHLGAYRTNWLFFPLSALGCALCCIPGSFAISFVAMILYGLGIAYGTVGLTVYATDLSDPEEFPDTMRRYELSLKLGCLLFSAVPGILADWIGNYVPSYMLATIFSLLAMIILQLSYRSRKALLRSRETGGYVNNS